MRNMSKTETKGNLRMNKENIRTLINALKQSKTFTMEFYYHEECGSPACIAGHVSRSMKAGKNPDYLTLVSGFLGVSEKMAECIIKPEFRYAHWDAGSNPEEKITKTHAIRMLERLLETGLVDWQGSKEEPKVKVQKIDNKKFDMAEWLNELEIDQTPSHLLFERFKQKVIKMKSDKETYPVFHAELKRLEDLKDDTNKKRQQVES